MRLGQGWGGDGDAWQWQAMGWIAVGGFVCSLLFVTVIVLRQRALAALTLGSWGVLAALFLKLFEDSGLTSNQAQGWIAISVLVALGAGAVALATKRPRSA